MTLLTGTTRFRSFSALALIASAALAACSGADAPVPPPDGEDGAACTTDADCGSGMECNGGACELAFDSGTEGGEGEGETCADIEVSFTPVTPTVVLLIDQSGSMTESYPGGNRWDVLYDALMSPSDGVVVRLEDQVRFGLSLYTSYNGFAGGECPVLTETAGIALGSYDDLDAIYGPAAPESETPTGEALALVAENLAAFPEAGPKIVILATDGEPDTCAQPNPQNGQGVAIAAAEGAYVAGVQTYILGVGNDVGAAHLQDMANAGAGLPLDTPTDAAFYQPQNKGELVDAFTGIIDGQRSCVLTIDGEVDPARADEGKVYLDGELLGYEDPNGWRLNSPSEIELVGDSCDAIKTGEHSVTGSFPCGAVAPLPR